MSGYFFGQVIPGINVPVLLSNTNVFVIACRGFEFAPLVSTILILFRFVIGALHSNSEHREIGMRVMGHSLVRSLAPLARSLALLARLLRTTCFARAFRCAPMRSPGRSLARS